MSYTILDERGSLSVYFGQKPTLVQLRKRLAKGRQVEFVQINLRVQDGHGMTAFAVSPQHLQDFQIRHGRNVIGSTVLAGLGADVQIQRGPIAIVGWLRAYQRMAPLPKQFINAIEHAHACVLAAFAGGEVDGEGSTIRDIGEFLKTADIMTRRPVIDFFGRDRSYMRWYACPNRRCAHGGLFHDAHSPDDLRYQCCINGCPCGKETTGADPHANQRGSTAAR